VVAAVLFSVVVVSAVFVVSVVVDVVQLIRGTSETPSLFVVPARGVLLVSKEPEVSRELSLPLSVLFVPGDAAKTGRGSRCLDVAAAMLHELVVSSCRVPFLRKVPDMNFTAVDRVLGTPRVPSLEPTYAKELWGMLFAPLMLLPQCSSVATSSSSTQPPSYVSA
jgi:hypothetical protein